MLKRILPIALAISLAGEAVMAATIEMVVDNKVYNVELADHAAAQDFMSRLPMTLSFENFGQTERIAYLKNALKLGNAPTSTTPVVGDFAYYIPWGNVCVLLKTSVILLISFPWEKCQKKPPKQSAKAGIGL